MKIIYSLAMLMVMTFLSSHSYAQPLLNLPTAQSSSDTTEVEGVQENETVQTAPPPPVPKEQPKPKKEKANTAASKVYFGGTVGMSFGSYTRIGLYPIIGYKVAPKLSGALKLGYEYINDNRYSTTYTSSNYGASVIARYRILPIIYAHVEYEMFNYDLYQSNGNSERTWVPFLYLGGGVSKNVGGNSWVMAQVLFDVLQNENSPYNKGAAIFSLGVGVGF